MSHSLTMNREGSFVIKTYGPNHCGVGSKIAIRYSLVCECRPTLDHRGFLFDQLNVDRYFKEIKRTSLSCERLVMRCTHDLIAQIRAENKGCQIDRMQLTLSPEPFAASMIYIWNG